jgi:hypothetical protein
MDRSRGKFWRRRFGLAAGVVVALATVIVLTTGSSAPRLVPEVDRARADAVGPPMSVTVGAPLRARPIAPGFLGLSIEYRTIEEYSGMNPHAINPVLVQLIAALSPGQRPEIRIGGDSTDRTWWPGKGATRPLGAYIKLNRRWGEVAAALIHALNARTMLGIDLEADSTRTARVEATKLIDAFGRHYVEALELGNEPELYDKFTWYHVNGQKMTGRSPATWDFPTYLAEYTAIADAVPHLPVVGPAVGLPRWTALLPDFIAAEPRVKIVTLHKYPLQLCYIPPSWNIYPTIPHLLSRQSSVGLADSVAPQVRIAHANGLPIRIDEINTISCGKAPAVGKSFASALWALNTLFAFARVGVDGVNMHTYVGSTYALFRFHDRGGSWTGVVNPEYYGMLMFAQAAPAHSRLLRIGGARRAGVDAWATRAPGGVIRVVLINDGARARLISLHVHGVAGDATVERLIAPSLSSRFGVTLGGDGFGVQTPTGVLPPPKLDAVAPVRGAYPVAVPGESAALLTFNAP